MMNMYISVCALTVGVLLLSGCSPKKRASAVPSDDPGRDYSQVLRNVRERSAEAMNVDRLNASIATFETELGRQPTNLTELVQLGFIDEIPDAPKGTMFVYNPVKRTLSIDRSPDAVVGP